jgi:hypothetical protein
MYMRCALEALDWASVTNSGVLGDKFAAAGAAGLGAAAAGSRGSGASEREREGLEARAVLGDALGAGALTLALVLSEGEG